VYYRRIKTGEKNVIYLRKMGGCKGVRRERRRVWWGRHAVV